MTITANSLPIRAYGYPPVEWDATIERFNVRPPDSLVEPVGGWGTLRIEVGAQWSVTAGVVSRDSAGDDWTTFRGCPTQFEAYDLGEPYGETTGSLNVPALTIFDNLDQFHLAAVDIYRVLPPRLQVVYGRTEVPHWHGFIQSPELGDGAGNRTGVRFQIYGAMFGEISLRAHQPLMVPDLQDAGTWLGRALDPQAYSRPGQAPFHFQFDSDTTDIELRHRGTRGQFVVDYCDEVLAFTQTPTTLWTIARTYDADGFPVARTYSLREKSGELAGAIQQNYVTAGGFGVSVSLSVDPTQVPNAVYGEGLAPSGERWRNAVYPLLTDDPPADPDHYPVSETDPDGNDDDDFTADVVTQLQGQLRTAGWPDVQVTGIFDEDTTTALNALYESQGHDETGEITDSDDWALVWATGSEFTDLLSGTFRPTAVRTEVEPFTRAPDGDITGDNPDFDPYAIRVEQPVSFPDGTSKARAIRWSRRLVNQSVGAEPYVGTITLTSDPTDENGGARSRLDIREGSWIRLVGAAGSYIDFYVAGVQAAPESYAAPVTLTVATKPWDLLTVATAIARADEAKADPGKSRALRSRPSRPWREAVGWDRESGAGLLRDFEHAGGEWVVKRFVAGGFAGTIATLDLLVKPAQEYVFAVFATPVDPGDLATLIPDPLLEDPDGYGWWNHPDSLADLDAWGFIDAWGSFELPGGYWPGLNKDDFAVTGKVKDAAGWPFAIDLDNAPFLWAAWWVPASGSHCRGSMKIVIDEG